MMLIKASSIIKGLTGRGAKPCISVEGSSGSGGEGASGESKSPPPRTAEGFNSGFDKPPR